MLKLIYQLDIAEFQLKQKYLTESIIKWNEINQYSSQDHLNINKYLIEDSFDFEIFSKEFSKYYSNSNSYYFISIYKDKQMVKGIYFPFKKEACPIKIIL